MRNCLLGIWNVSLVALLAQSLAAQKFLGFPLSDTSVPVWHGWLYDDSSYHGGVDYLKPLGTAVLAAAGGIAMASSQPSDPNHPNQDTYGTFVLIQHANGFSTLYAHLSASAPGVAVFSSSARYNSQFGSWTPVNKGDVIGFVGLSGMVTTSRSHVHFEVANNPAGTYSGHVQNRVDSYDLFNVGLFYPPTGVSFTACGAQFLWTSCPIAPSPGTITFSFTGVVTSTYDTLGLLQGKVAVGDRVSGVFAYDTEAPDGNLLDPTFGSYAFRSGPAGIWVTVETSSGQLRFTQDYSSYTAAFWLVVLNGYQPVGDLFQALGYGSSRTFDVPVLPSGNTAVDVILGNPSVVSDLLSSDALPLSLDLSRSAPGYRSGAVYSATINNGWSIQFSLTSLTLR